MKGLSTTYPLYEFASGTTGESPVVKGYDEMERKRVEFTISRKYVHQSNKILLKEIIVSNAQRPNVKGKGPWS